MNSYSRILVGVDFSEAARAAFEYALGLSRRDGAKLLVVHAVTTDWPYKWHARERRALIASLRSATKSAGVRFKIIVESGDPAGVILQQADARGADIVVLGASERTGLDRFRFGSVAETVAVDSTKPVLVIPAHAGRDTDASTPRKSILVAIDLNEGSTAAVARALSMAGDSTRVTVVHVVPGVPLAGCRVTCIASENWSFSGISPEMHGASCLRSFAQRQHRRKSMRGSSWATRHLRSLVWRAKPMPTSFW